MFNGKNYTEEQQTLSRLMDGEWADLNPSDCVLGLCKDDALKAKWERYHLMRDVMRDEPVNIDNALSLRISAAIADEPAYSNVTSLSGHSAVGSTTTGTSSGAKTLGSMPSWRSGLAGLGIAASVAMVTVVGMNQTQNSSQDNSVAPQVASVTAEEAFSQQVPGAPLPEVEFVANTGTSGSFKANTGSFWVSPDSSNRVAAEEKLNMFLTEHMENSPTAVREGMLPFSRLVGYDEAAPVSSDSK